ncbi:MAG: hypothetical protein ACR2JJ_07920 [Sphingomicrobium sp.]
MDDGALSAALERAERALARVESAIAQRKPESDEDLRDKVREAVAELDQLIRESAG